MDHLLENFGGRPDSSGNFPSTANVDIIQWRKVSSRIKANSDSNWATNNTTGTDFFAIKTGEVEGQEGFEAWTFRSFCNYKYCRKSRHSIYNYFK